MSMVMTKPKRRKQNSSAPASKRHKMRPVEAPETAVIKGEPPESQALSWAEAPEANADAGHFLGNVFTHGRSKS